MNGEVFIQNGDFSILNGEKFPVEVVFKKKIKNASEKHLNGEISILHSEWRKLSVDIFFLKFKTRLKKNWMEKSPFRMEISPFWMEKIICGICFSKKKFKTLLKKIEWRTLSVGFFLKFKPLLKKNMNGEISIQNGENCPILNGEILWSLFFKKKSKRFWKKWMEKSSFRTDISPFWTEKIPCRCFIFKKKSKTLLKNMEKSPFSMEISQF